jgi:hypothetical protein
MAMHGGHQEVAGTPTAISGENAPRPICPMCRRRETKDEYSRVSIAKSGNGPGPISVVTKGGALHARDLGAVAAQPHARRARNDVVVNLAE